MPVVSMSSFLKLSLACLLLAPLLLTIVNRPFSFVYSYLHSSDDLFARAEELNKQRTHAALRYFKDGAVDLTKEEEGAAQRHFLKSNSRNHEEENLSEKEYHKVSRQDSGAESRKARMETRNRSAIFFGRTAYPLGRKNINSNGNIRQGLKSKHRQVYPQHNHSTPHQSPRNGKGSSSLGEAEHRKNYSIGGDGESGGTLPHTRTLLPSQGCEEECGIAVGIVTMKRHAPGQQLGYVIQTAAALHSLLRRHRQQASPPLSDTKNSPFRDSVLYVCNVDNKPGEHPDAVFLRDYVLTVERYSFFPSTYSHQSSSSANSSVSSSSLLLNVSAMTVPGTEDDLLYNELRHQDRIEKERFDYMFCLQAGMRLFQPRYILLVEDDAIALPDMTVAVEHALRRLTKTHPVLSRPRVSCNETYSSSSSSSSTFLRPCDSLDHPRFSPPPLLPRLPTNRVDFSDLVAGGIADNASVPLQQLNLPIPVSGFVYLKLFFPLRWQGFAFEFSRVLDFICMTVVISWMIIAAFRVLVALAAVVVEDSSSYRRWKRRVAIWSNRRLLRVVFFSSALVIMAGRQNVIELRRLSPHLFRLQPSPSCCTPAVLYTSEVIPALITWLAHSPDIHVDLAVMEFVERSGLPAYSLEPNLFSHIGKVTSLSKKSRVRAEELVFHEPLTLF